MVMEFPSPDANPLEREFSFIGSAPYFAYMDITVSREFTIVLEDYQPTNSGSQQSVFSIQNLGSLAYLTKFRFLHHWGAIPALDAPGNKCDSVNGLNGSAGNPPPLSFAGLDAGTYRVGFFENGSPTNVQADFRVSAVPVPAAGFLLVGALGGLAALRRRKKAAAAA